MLAMSFAVGLAVGHLSGGHGPFWPWAAAGATAVGAASASRMVRSPLTPLFLAGAVVCLGAMWLSLRLHTVAADDLAARASDAPVLVHLRGTALESPRLRDRAAGSMARFGHRPPTTSFPVRVTALVPRTGPPVPASGTVLVRVEQTVAERAGFSHHIGPWQA